VRSRARARRISYSNAQVHDWWEHPLARSIAHELDYALDVPAGKTFGFATVAVQDRVSDCMVIPKVALSESRGHDRVKLHPDQLDLDETYNIKMGYLLVGLACSVRVLH